MASDAELTSMNYVATVCSTCSRPMETFAIQTIEAEKTYVVSHCNSCRLGVTVPSPDDATLHELHSTQYYRNGEGVRFVSLVEWLVEGMRRWRIHRLSLFVHTTGTGRALDIGCGSGRYLLALRDSGWEVAGLELNDDTATAARNVHGLVVETDLKMFTAHSFDLITITHVLEHIREPRQTLAECAQLLKPGGVIAVAVPNIESWQALFTRESWFHLDLPRHLWHFSELWLSRTLRDLGFEIVTVRRMDLAHNIFGWLQSLLNRLGLKHNRFYSFLSSDDLETDGGGGYVSLVMSLFLIPLLLPVSVVLAFMEALFHAGGTVELIASRAAVTQSNDGGLS